MVHQSVFRASILQLGYRIRTTKTVQGKVEKEKKKFFHLKMTFAVKNKMKKIVTKVYYI
jgi:hypothetical protein